MGLRALGLGALRPQGLRVYLEGHNLPLMLGFRV